jgi:carbamoyltransferase
VSRIFPFQKEAYYKFRRRKMLKPRADSLMHYAKYMMTGIGVLPLCRSISKAAVSRELRKKGFENFHVYSIDHHASHAATAAFTSGMKKALVITLDGVGDGLSGSISVLNGGSIERTHSIKARDSLGTFYEQVTNIVGMRELEDEGKVMAMADYSFPFQYENNGLKDFFKVEGLDIKAKHGPISQYDLLARIAWGMPREQFAYMAQQVVEKTLEKFVANAVDEYAIGNIAFAGGLMSNIKANMRIRNLKSVKDWHIFPHMGDGGIALGAALYANYLYSGTTAYEFPDAYLGDSYDENEIKKALKLEGGLEYELDKDKESHAAEIIEKDNYLLWFQGRAEYGPRALGDRSILANSGSDSVKERLNTYVKQREWYQPFAPSVLFEDAKLLLEDVKGRDRFMTMGYRIKDSNKEMLKSVIHIDNTARPQMVGNENKPYQDLLRKVKKHSGYGVVLNTSFNIHGMPIVRSPRDALQTMKRTRSRYMFLGGYFVENKKAKGETK